MSKKTPSKAKKTAAVKTTTKKTVAPKTSKTTKVKKVIKVAKVEVASIAEEKLIKFEDCSDRIDVVIKKLRHHWKLTAISWMDFDDVGQRIRLRILDKWSKWDQKRSFEPWAHTLGRNCIQNIVRDVYYNAARPCLDCKFNLGGDKCSAYGFQNSSCAVFAKWEKTKQLAYNAKFPTSIHDTHDPSGLRAEVCSLPESNMDFSVLVPQFAEKFRKVLKPTELIVFEYFFEKGESEEQVTKRLGFKLDEDRKSPRCKQFQNIKKVVIDKAKLIIRDMV